MTRSCQCLSWLHISAYGIEKPRIACCPELPGRAAESRRILKISDSVSCCRCRCTVGAHTHLPLAVHASADGWRGQSACTSLFDPELVVNLQTEERWWVRGRAAAAAAAAEPAVFSSLFHVFQEVQREAGSLHNVQNVHARTHSVSGGHADIRVSLVHLHGGTCSLQPVHPVMNNTRTHFFFFFLLTNLVWR